MAAACKLAFLRKTQHVADPFLHTWSVTVCTQTIQCLSIVSACFLYLKPFLNSVEAGFIRNNDMRLQASSNAYLRRSSFLARSRRPSMGLRSLTKAHHKAVVTSGDLMGREDVASQHSQAHMIRETRTFTVEESADVPGHPSLLG